MLRIRMREGLPITSFTPEQQARLLEFYNRGLFEEDSWEHGHAVLSLQGRLLADQVVRDLLF